MAEDTLRLANEAINGQLVLPGTGPDLCYVGNPPQWTVNPVNDNEYTFATIYFRKDTAASRVLFRLVA